MSWSLSHIEKLKAEGKIKGFKVIGEKPGQPSTLPKKKKVEPTGIKFIKKQLDKNNIPYCTELQFAKPRKFRFDVAIPALKVAFEYEGLVATGKKGGHQTKAGFTSNCTKYNLAVEKGWKLYRYTAKNYKDFENDLKIILCTE